MAAKSRPSKQIPSQQESTTMRTVPPSMAPKFTAFRDPASTVANAVIKQFARLALPANLAKLGVSPEILLLEGQLSDAVAAGNRKAGFGALRKWAAISLKGFQRHIVEHLIDAGGTASIKDIAKQAGKHKDVASSWFRDVKNLANVKLRPKKWIIEIAERGKRGKGPGVAELHRPGRRGARK